MHSLKAPLILVALLVSSTAADSPKGLTGRVVDEKGQPVAGAKVAAVGFLGDDRAIPEPASVVTGADGSFRLDANSLHHCGVIVASKEGKCSDWAYAAGADSAGLVLLLGPPAAIDGEVVDEAGKPVAGASVALLLSLTEPQDKKMLAPLGADAYLAKTDAQGRFRFASLPEQAMAAFDITAAGRARVKAEGRFAPGQKGLRLVLPPEGRIEGAVVEKAGGRPLAGVIVSAMSSLTSGFHHAIARTDANGRFSMAGMSAGKYTVEITGDGNALPEWIGSQEKLQVENGKAAESVIEAARGGVLEIAVVDAATGKTIGVVASIQVAPAKDLRISHTASTGRDGVARSYLLPGKYVVSSMRVTGYAYKEEKGRLFSVEVGKTERAVVSVAAVPQIALAVTDVAGKPAPAATGQVLPMFGPPRAVVADANGRLALAAADLGPLFCFVLVRDAQRNLAALAAVAKDEKSPAIVLRPPCKMSGTVKDAKGRPVGNASVQAQIDASHMGRYAVVARTRTDKEGNYRLDLPYTTMQYAISARAPGFSAAEVVVNQPQMAQGDEIVKHLTLKAVDRTLRGSVQNAEGKPVPGAIITATAIGHREFPGSAVTDAAGRFVLENLDSDPVIYIFGRVPGRGWIADGTIKPGDKELTLTVAPSHWD